MLRHLTYIFATLKNTFTLIILTKLFHYFSTCADQIFDDNAMEA